MNRRIANYAAKTMILSVASVDYDCDYDDDDDDDIPDHHGNDEDDDGVYLDARIKWI